MITLEIMTTKKTSDHLIPGNLILMENSMNLWLGVCRWDSETLRLQKTTFKCSLQPYYRLDTDQTLPFPRLPIFQKLYYYHSSTYARKAWKRGRFGNNFQSIEQ